jgi:hypothetical protein
LEIIFTIENQIIDKSTKNDKISKTLANLAREKGMSVKAKQVLVSIGSGVLLGILVVTLVRASCTASKTENVPAATTEFADWERAAAEEFIEATRDSCGKGNADDCELLTILDGARADGDIP